MLDRLYHKFDLLSDKYSVFKVETIGDAWMGATNLVKDQSRDHVQRIVEFSKEAIQAANQTLIDEDDPGRGFVNIRVGKIILSHSGCFFVQAWRLFWLTNNVVYNYSRGCIRLS